MNRSWARFCQTPEARSAKIKTEEMTLKRPQKIKKTRTSELNPPKTNGQSKHNGH